MKISSRIITKDRTPILFGTDSLTAIDRLAGRLNPRGIFILTDRNTKKHCLPLICEKSASVVKAEIIETEAGEAAKSLENAGKIWNELLSFGANRQSLLINLGGGVISDLGGFVAAGYKRGIKYINIPTSLMGMADAAIGGKTAVNLGKLKNQVGFFHAAAGIIISPEFLKTLPEPHLRSGFAEIIKSTLISDPALWRRLQRHSFDSMVNLPFDSSVWLEVLQAAIVCKNKIVVSDYRERNRRKVLNFGHTLGHAFESLSLGGAGSPVLHGDAVAAGMICAAFLSNRKVGLTEADMRIITSYIYQSYGHLPIQSVAGPDLMQVLRHDKKMCDNKLMFTMIKKPGFPVINISCDENEVSESLEYYNSLTRM